MTKKFLLLGAAVAVALAVAAGTFLRPGRADAETPFVGSWDVTHVDKAPWVEGDYQPMVHEDIAKGRITFMNQSVQAPGFLNCDKAKFEVTEVPPEFLFQGNLTDPANQAKELGYKGGKIHNLAMSCPQDNADVGMDFSLIEEDHIVFALDNMIYHLERVKN